MATDREDEDSAASVEIDDNKGLVGVDALHAAGVTGDKVTIAFVDSGLTSLDAALMNDLSGRNRILAVYDATSPPAIGSAEVTDYSGHGTHIVSLAASSYQQSGRYEGIAPDADLVIVKAFGADGAGSYLDVIAGIDWVISNQARYNIRVLNLSFSAPPNPTTGTTR